MNRLNPRAVGLWIFGACIGYLIGDTTGAVAGLAAAVGLTLIVG